MKKAYVSMRLRGRLSLGLWSRLYRDTNHDPARGVLVVGTARSGTTWLAEIIGRVLPYRIVFEPFRPTVLGKAATRPLFPFVPSGSEDPELADFVRSMLAGPPRDRWLDGHVDILRPRGRIVKLVRACLVTGWLRAVFPEVPLVLLLRHPCAVVDSRLRLGWDPAHDLESLLALSSLVEEHLAPHAAVLRGARSAAAANAAIWAIHTKVMFETWPSASRAPAICYYEDLCSAPHRALTTLADELGSGTIGEQVLARERPSRTAQRDAAVLRGRNAVSAWRRNLDAGSVREILDIVNALGLGHLYGDAPEPLDVGRG